MSDTPSFCFWVNSWHFLGGCKNHSSGAQGAQAVSVWIKVEPSRQQRTELWLICSKPGYSLHWGVNILKLRLLFLVDRSWYPDMSTCLNAGNWAVTFTPVAPHVSRESQFQFPVTCSKFQRLRSGLNSNWTSQVKFSLTVIQLYLSTYWCILLCWFVCFGPWCYSTFG